MKSIIIVEIFLIGARIARDIQNAKTYEYIVFI